MLPPTIEPHQPGSSNSHSLSYPYSLPQDWSFSLPSHSPDSHGLAILSFSGPYDAAVARVLASLHSLSCSSASLKASWWMQYDMAELNSSTEDDRVLVSAYVQTHMHEETGQLTCLRWSLTPVRLARSVPRVQHDLGRPVLPALLPEH